MMKKISKTDAEWKALLTDEQYRVMREAGTEPPFSGEYDQFWEAGTYSCAGCGHPLFDSKSKFSAGCGWPSFHSELDSARIVQQPDFSHGMSRIELCCPKCGAHLGHVFADGPPPTGQRYCINSVSLEFQEQPDEDGSG